MSTLWGDEDLGKPQFSLDEAEKALVDLYHLHDNVFCADIKDRQVNSMFARVFMHNLV